MTLRLLPQTANETGGTLVIYHFGDSGLDPTFHAAAPGIRIYNETLEPGKGLYAKVTELPADAPRPHYYAGFSEGCQGVRTQLARGTSPAGVVACDGIHASRPPAESQLKPWRDYFMAAAGGNVQAYVSHSSIEPGTYLSTTETIPLTVPEGLAAMPASPTNDGGTIQRLGSLYVLSYAGTDKAAHIYQGRVVMPNMIARLFRGVPVDKQAPPVIIPKTPPDKPSVIKPTEPTKPEESSGSKGPIALFFAGLFALILRRK